LESFGALLFSPHWATFTLVIIEQPDIVIEAYFCPNVSTILATFEHFARVWRLSNQNIWTCWSSTG